MNGVELVASWLTPTVLFCVMNVMIGTIFFRSSLKPPRTKQQIKDEQQPPPQHHNQQQFDRVPSFFERVKSFNLSRYETQQQPDPLHRTVPAQEPVEVAPASSDEIDELRSHHVMRTESYSAAAPASRDEIDELRSHHVMRTESDSTAAPASRDDEVAEPDHVMRTESDEVAEAVLASRDEVEEPHHHVMRTKSEALAKAVPAARVLQKSTSVKVSTVKEEEEEERRRPETARVRGAGEDEVDDKADDFINKFRQQLRLQRLDSLVRYNDMINRGSGRWR